MLGVGAEDSVIWDLLGIFLPKLFCLAEGGLVLRGWKYRVQVHSELLHYFIPVSSAPH